MRVIRRRALFYQRRTSNLYRVFGLFVFILGGVWFTTQLDKGAIRNPFSPTPTSTRTVNSWALEGETLFQAGNLNAAIAAYQQATLVAQDARVWAELARIQAYSSRLLSNDVDRLGRLSEALASADQAVALAPDDSYVHAIRAFVLDWNADPALDILRTGEESAADLLFQAEQEALHATQLDGQNPLALAYLAEILIDQQRWTQAEQNIGPALELGPHLMDVHRVHGYFLESTANYRQAIEEYQLALEINPNLTFLYIAVGVNYRTLAFRSPPGAQQTDLYNQALDHFAKAATINDQLQIRDPLPYLAIAKVYAQEGQFLQAALNAQKAVDLDARNADLYGQLGNIYKRGRNFEASIVALKCAVLGCSPDESCQARNGCAEGDEGTQVVGLPLSPNSATYYLDYGSVLAAFSPRFPEYCTVAVDVLTRLKDAYGDDPIIARNADDGLSICASVAQSQLQTPTPYFTPTLLPTPRQ
jgi:tetratricopeptide (TPR) repeat protein